jgi:hypothetical protein
VGDKGAEGYIGSSLLVLRNLASDDSAVKALKAAGALDVVVPLWAGVKCWD